MKKTFKILNLLSAFALIIALASFSSPDFLPTKLRITVIDELGNNIEGATVTIYKSETDYRNSKNQVDSQLTDKKGRVTFKDLDPISYYIDARTSNKNNDGKGAVTAPLLEGKLNKVNTVIE